MLSSYLCQTVMKRKYKHLFFDLDHTLWDFDKNSETTLRILYDEFLLTSFGIDDFSTFYKHYSRHNDRMWERFRKGQMRREELRWKRMWHTLLEFKIADTTLAHQLSERYLELLPIQTALTPHAKEILDHCKGRYQMHLITNGFETTQWQKLRNAQLESYFEEVITSETSNSLKPHKEIFDYALSKTGATIEESLMIGDALEIDILGAQQAGWDQVYYNPYKQAHQRKPTYEITCWKELIPLL